MDFNKEFVEVVERFNAAHSPDVKVEIIKKIEYDVHLYSIEYDRKKAYFTVSPKSTAEVFEHRLNEHYDSIQNLRED